jgi:tetratricopeptide (TPR) repeat protein
MNHFILERVQLLLSQGRVDEADTQIRTFLEEDPTSEYGRYLLAYILFFKGKSRESEQVLLQLQSEDPGNTGYLALLAEINLKEKEYREAEIKTNLLLEMSPDEVEYHNLKSRLKFAQRFYDGALQFSNSALVIDPENLEALNQKALLAGILGDKVVATNAVLEALEKNPQDPYTIANHGHQLLSEGKVKEALERLSEALRLNPTNSLARYAMQEALKARFWPYRLFYHYIHFMARLTAKGSWSVLIGVFVIYQVILMVGRSNEALGAFLMPIAYVMAGLFLLSWIINPLMNLYLMTNTYGRLLLDDEEKKMAKLTGLSLILSLISFLLWYFQGMESFFVAGVFFIAMMIPLGSFLSPYDETNKQKLIYFTAGIFVSGVIGIILDSMTFLYIALFGIFIYQFIANSMAISSSSRRVED